MGCERLGTLTGCAWPPAKAAHAQPLLAEPVSLAVIHEHLHRRRPPIAKGEDRSAERILTKRMLAQGHQAVDPLAKIDRFNRDQEPHLRGDLQHHRPSQRVRPRATKSGTWPAGSWTRSVEPVGSENSSTHGLGNSGPGGNSVNAAGGLDRPGSATGTGTGRAGSRFFSA
jgi:hypothetical protein